MIWNGDGAALCPMVGVSRAGPDRATAHSPSIARTRSWTMWCSFRGPANPAKAAIDMALYDIAGQALGHQL